ncbi:Glycerophosphocholine phosphodiesterase [Podochytrium sp. JEL0797]|nr:Glycerophosphocholine phosphodiesterase [Podochytrium sp. JEL0797]
MTDLLHVSAISFDRRRHTLSCIQWAGIAPSDPIRLSVSIEGSPGKFKLFNWPVILIRVQPTDETELQIDSPSQCSTGSLEALLQVASTRTSALVVKLLTNSTTFATGRFDLSTKIESLCGERAPKAGRFSVPVENSAGVQVATVTLESSLTTRFEHPLAHVPSTVTKLNTGSTALVGHRGIGMNAVLFAKDSRLPHISENTIESFAEALREGVQFVEFDAQVSKDMKAVLYHDSIVSEYKEHTEIKDLTQAQFLATQPKFGVNPFTTLEHALKTLPESLGFNIEIKYPMPDEIDTDRLETIEYNAFVDVILETTLTHAGNRPIVFSCFNPEACRMAKEKQSRYPVLFLTMAGTHPTLDPRSESFIHAAQFARHANLDGVVTDAKGILENPGELVQAAKEIMGEGCVVFTYGAGNCVVGNARRLKEAGVDGVIVDTVAQVREELCV